jgi:syntaxin 7
LLQQDDAQRRIQIEALDNEIEFNETLISEREGEIQGIEQGITELNEIFRDLGMLVNEQESGIRKYRYRCIYQIHSYLIIYL